MGNKIRAHIIASGRVQGVFFRDNTRRKAEQFGVSGWVKNLKDDKVEAVFEGDRENVEKIVNWARQGPDSASVNNFEIEWQEHKGEFENFKIVY